MRKFLVCSFLFFSSICLFADSIEIDWRKAKWPSVNYTKTPVNGGASIYHLKEDESGITSMNFYFRTGAMTVPEDLYETYSAAASFYIEGGIGKRSYEELNKFLTQEVITLKVDLSSKHFVVTTQFMKEDFDVVLGLLEDVFFRPNFSSKSFKVWKKNKKDFFSGFVDGASSEERSSFMRLVAHKHLLGKEHFFSNSLIRMNHKSTDRLKLSKIKSSSKYFINKSDLNVFLSGDFSEINVDKIKKLINKIPEKDPTVLKWLPNRPRNKSNNSDNKTDVILVTKKGMTQTDIHFWQLLPKIGRLNELEKAQQLLLSEIYYSTLGGIGESRFSKALRIDTGIAYFPWSQFNLDYLYPNTNVGLWKMGFQAQNNRVFEGLQVMYSTWKKIVDEGVSKGELDKSRISLINSNLTRETTVFLKMSYISSLISEGKLPTSNPWLKYILLLDQQKDVSSMNKYIKHMIDFPRSSLVVLMGDLDQQFVQKLNKSDQFRLISEIKFKDLIKEIEKK